jgi:multiple sugar transport system substrate-binding protein
MRTKSLYAFLGILIVASMMLAACQPAAPAAPAEPAAPAAPAEPARSRLNRLHSSRW